MLAAIGCATLAACAANGPHESVGIKISASRGPVAVPAEFRAACGHPGRTVIVLQVPVTVRHADCDLTGVTIQYGHASVVVPKPGESAGAIVDLVRPDSEPTEINVGTAVGKLDITVTG
jgi:hypothetical protein